MSTPATSPAATAPAPLPGQLRQVILATCASTIGFWAWMSISPLQQTYAKEMGLGQGEISLMIATPILVGALGRVPVGALTDRLGGRKMFTAVLLGAVPAVLLVALAGSLKSYWLLIAAGFYLGLAGTVFAIGIPFSSAWYEPARRGFANGIFGMGMGGTALSMFFTPRLARTIGVEQTYFLIAAMLVVMATLVWFLMKESPVWKPNVVPVVPRVVGALKLPITWQMSFIYAIVFGGFVAFSTYLPKYLITIYPDDVDQIGAGTRTATFALAAVIARPIGGVLADRIGPKPIAALSLVAVAALAVVVSIQPPEGVLTGTTFLAMAAAMGVGMGAVFSWVPKLAPPDKVGSVTGVVAAAGGLGGYFPPLVMGATYNAEENSYALGLWLLVIAASAALALTLSLRPKQAAKAPV